MLFHPRDGKQYGAFEHPEGGGRFAICDADRAVFFRIDYKGDYYVGKRLTEAEMDERGFYFDERGQFRVRDEARRHG